MDEKPSGGTPPTANVLGYVSGVSHLAESVAEGEISVVVPPPSMFVRASEDSIFLMLMTAFMILVGWLTFATLQRPGSSAVLGLMGCVAFGLGTVQVIRRLARICRWGRLPIVFVASSQSLRVSHPTVWGIAPKIWRAEDLTSIRVTRAGLTVTLRRLVIVKLVTHGYFESATITFATYDCGLADKIASLQRILHPID